MAEHRYIVRCVGTLVQVGEQKSEPLTKEEAAEFVKQALSVQEELGFIGDVRGPWSLFIGIEHVPVTPWFETKHQGG